MTERDTFPVIYAKLAARVTDDAARRRVRRPPLRNASVADVSILDVPRDTLLAVVDDSDFVSSSYLVLVDAAPTPGQLREARRRLEAGEISRSDLWDEIMASPRFVNGNRRVNFT